MERANPYSGFVGSLTPAELEDPSDAVEERGLRDETGFGTLAEAAEMSRPSPPCPRCGASPARRGGLGPSGVRRRRCPACGARSTSLTGTVLEGCKKQPLATWVPFIRLAPFAVPPGACAEARRISRRTARERRHRPFAAVDGHRGRIVPRGRVRVDGACVNDADPSEGYGRARKRGPSKRKPCMAVGVDARKEPVASVCGHGEPSAARIGAAPGGHVAEGAALVHDRERAHSVPVGENGLADELCKADARDPGYLEAMEPASNLRSRPKRHLRRFTGMDPESLLSYLNPYLLLQGQARRREVAQDCKGGPPSAHGRSEVPQVRGRSPITYLGDC